LLLLEKKYILLDTMRQSYNSDSSYFYGYFICF